MDQCVCISIQRECVFVLYATIGSSVLVQRCKGIGPRASVPGSFDCPLTDHLRPTCRDDVTVKTCLITT